MFGVLQWYRLVKKDGSLWLRVNYWRLNGLSEGGTYPMPQVDKLIDQVGKTKFISTLGLTRGYWQVPVAKDSQPKTAIVTPFRLFQINVMPFGLQGALATFQRLIDKVLHRMEEFAAAYLNDVVIFSDSWSVHLEHLTQFFDSIRSAI